MKQVVNNAEKPYRTAIYLRPLLFLWCLLNFGALSAATIHVSSLSALQKAINNANAGDHIVLADGSYKNNALITINRRGTASQPIVISAASIGGVTITGSSGFSMDSLARYITIKGFIFKHSADTANIIQYGASHCRFTRNVFELSGTGSYLIVRGDDAEIDYNTFQNKSTEGRMILVEGPGGTPIAQHTWIHHNYFNNFENSGFNNSSAIQFGRSWCSLTPAYGLVEYNLFINCHGENENIAHKASNCVYRYNTFGPGSSELSLRHGNHTEVYGNFFLNTEGLRIFGDDHRIYSNYFEGNSRAIHLGNGDGEVADGAKLTAHDRPDRCEIVYNTLVNNAQHFYMGGRKNGLGATHTTIANNIIQGGGQAAEIRGPNTHVIWEGNMVWNTSEVGDILSGGYQSANPLLSKNGSTTYHIQVKSPAINAGVGSYSYVNLDIDGHTRSTSPDIGADEFSTAPIQNRPLTVTDVGPDANPEKLSATTIHVNSIPTLQNAINHASPGDLIILADGVYTTSKAIRVARKGSASQPITITAETIGGAEIRGAAGFHISIPAAYIIIKGFKFTHNTGQARLEAGVTHCTITRNLYECAPAGKGNKPYLSISGDDTEISYNTFQNKDTEGCMVTIQGPGRSGMAQRTWIHHNYFNNFEPSGANNSSAIQPGLSSRSLTPAHTLIEYNLFIGCRGENEGIIANKSSDNIYRYNTFGQGSREVSLRHGDRMEVYGNFFMGNTGLRFSGDDHKIYSNYFENCDFAIYCTNGDGDVHKGDDLRSHDRPDNVQIVFNTLVNNKINYSMPDRRNGLGATGITFANNIIQGGEAISITGTYINPIWSGNILWQVQGGDMPSNGYETVNPHLSEDGNGVYHINSDSPAVNAATGAYSYVTLDIDGQSRNDPDKGADEFSAARVINRPLTVTDVGPNAYRDFR